MKFNFKGVKVDLKFGFAAVLTLCLLIDKSRISVYSILSAVLHECGHLIYLITVKKLPEEICFSVFGMKITKGKNSLSYKEEITAALSGPAVNLFLFLCMLFNRKLIVFSAVNLCLGLFNLLPAQPLDGGTALHYFLMYRNKNSIKIENIFTYVTAIILIISGIFVLIKSGYNFMLIVVGAYIIFYKKLYNRFQ